MRAFDPVEVCKRPPQSVYLLSDFQREFAEYSMSVHTPKTSLCVKTAFEQFIKVIGDIPIHDVSVRHVERFIGVKMKEASAWTARKHFAHMASAVERAIVWKKIEANPFRDVPNPKTP